VLPVEGGGRDEDALRPPRRGLAHGRDRRAVRGGGGQIRAPRRRASLRPARARRRPADRSSAPR
jgi:hypothetical protein